MKSLSGVTEAGLPTKKGIGYTYTIQKKTRLFLLPTSTQM